MIDKKIYHTFKQGSKTFFTSSLFFPKKVRDDIFIFYAFVRTADDLVDSIPAQLTEFEKFKSSYALAIAGEPAHDVIIDSFVELIYRRNIPLAWIESFLAAMESDTHKKTYNTIEELCSYMYGSAEVIGLVMSRLLDFPPESYTSAQMLGRGFQYINFIRDIAEDITLDRQYLPHEVLRPFGFETLNETTARNNPKQFKACILHELERYVAWQKQGEAGFMYMPKRYLLPIKTAADMYRYTARVIQKDPFIIFRKKVKPSKMHIMGRLLINIL